MAILCSVVANKLGERCTDRSQGASGVMTHFVLGCNHVGLIRGGFSGFGVFGGKKQMRDYGRQ